MTLIARFLLGFAKPYRPKAIPELGVKPLHYREACERIGLIHPKRGKRASAININIKEYYEVAVNSFLE